MSRQYRRDAILDALGKRGGYTKEQLETIMKEEERLKRRERSTSSRRSLKNEGGRSLGN